MNKTYAPNAIIFGILIGWLIAVKVNTVAGIVVGIIVTVIVWIIIRGIEKALGKGVDAIQNAYYRKKNESQSAHSTSESLAKLHGLSGGNPNPSEGFWHCSSCGETNDKNSSYCKSCGKYK